MKFETETIKGPIFGVRHVQVLLLLFNNIVIYYSRTYVGVILVAMTNAELSNPEFEEYQWSEKEKSYILSSLFWGFVIGQLPSAYFIRRYGIKISLFVFALATGILNALIPLCVHWGNWQIFCFFRFMQGLFQTGSSPASFQHLANWTPPSERNRLSGLMFTGLDIGAVIGISLTGVISESRFGWPGAFYASSLLCFLWCILWLMFGANNTATSKLITERERNYIEEALKNSVDIKKENISVPWNAILTSIPFWSLLIVRATERCGYYTIQVLLPSYMSGIFQVNIKANAFFSALPYLLAFLMTFVFMTLADLIRNKSILSLTATRKLFNSISMWLPATGIIVISFLDSEQKLLAMIITTICVGASSSVIFGGTISCIELAPNHTEIVVTIINIFINFSTTLGPLFAGFIVNDETNRFQWQIVFAALATIYVLGDVIFLIWGSSNIQPWNDSNFLTKKKKETSSQSEIITNRNNKKNSNDKVHNDIVEQTHL